MQTVLTDTFAQRPLYAPPEPTSFGDRIGESFANAMMMLFAAIPRILGFIIVVLIGWLVASLIARAVATLLRTVRYNDLAERTGIAQFTQRAGLTADPAEVVAGIVKWLIRIVVLLVAFDLLGLPAVSEVLREFLLWLPNLIVAIAVLLLAGVAANALANIVRGAAAEAGLANPDTLANVTRIIVWAFSVVVAVNQLGVARTLINTLFTGLISAVALAAGLAFGLGGREMAARKLEEWNNRTRGTGTGSARTDRPPSSP
ncbi:MAG: mechanosensitive ion channel family protein [Gemmatimonadaceae bacterium]